MSEVENAAAGVRLVRVIWLALLASIFIYAAVMFMAAGQAPESESFQAAFANPIILVLHAMGAGMFVLAFLVSSVVLRRLATPDHSRAPVSMTNTVAAGPRVRVGLLMRWALIESVAVFGLMAGFISRDPRLFLPLGGLAVAGMLLTYPSDSTLRDLAAV